MFLIGSVIFGIATYRARALPRGGALLLIAGAPGLFPFPPAGLVLLGGGWAWLGYALFFSDRSMVPAQQEPSGTRTEDLLLSVATRAAAVALGVIPTFVLLAGSFSDAAGYASSFTSFVLFFLAHMGIAAVLYAALGVAFGLAIPRPAWRWGLWLSVPTLFLFLTVFLPNILSNIEFVRAQGWTEPLAFLGYFAGPLVAGCLGAYAGARARPHFSSE